MRDLLIDADSFLFASAAVCERHSYIVKKADGSLHGPLTKRGDATRLMDSAADELFTHTELLPYEYARKAAVGKIEEAQAKAAARYGAVRPVIILSGSGNFRERVNARVPYKSNRASTPRPAHLHRLRQMAINEMGAQLIHLMEADDELGIRMTEKPDSIACSIDKDIRQLPGEHMIPEKGFMKVSERSATLRLYAQILSGDTTDGVPGCYRVGPDGAQQRILETSKGIPADELEAVLWTAVLAAYTRSVEQHADKCGYSDGKAAALETARFVHLLRQRPKDNTFPKLWSPPC